MITVAKVSSTGYYTDGDGGGMESYYLDDVTEGEPAGRWMGRAAEMLGLTGEVTADDMAVLFEESVNPVTGEKLGRRPSAGKTLRSKIKEGLAAEPEASPERQKQIRAEIAATHRGGNLGWDLTFSVPKSVSLAHAAAQRGMIAATRAGDEQGAEAYRFIKVQIEESIQTAAGAGLAAAEQLATARATGAAGGATTWHSGQGLAAATFFQHTNRSIEPHLHVHMVVYNKIQNEDGQWRAIDGRDLLDQQYDYSAVAVRTLIEGLSERLGLDWTDRHDGVGKELALVSEQERDAFSTRAVQTTAAMQPLVAAAEEDLGRPLTDQETFRIHKDSQRTSRERKAHDTQTPDERIDGWNAELIATTGRSMDALALKLRAAADQALPAHLQTGRGDDTRSEAARAEAGSDAGQRVAGWNGEWSRQEVLDKAVAGCAQRSATWGRADLKQEIERNLPVLGIGVDQVDPLLELLTDEALASAAVVQVTRPHTTTSSPTAGATSSTSATAEDTAGADAPAPLRFSAPSATVYAAADTLAAESALRAAAIERGRFALDREQVTGWLDAKCASIGPDQRAAVEGLASSDAALAVMVGPAGTGKSFAAGALAGAWNDLTDGQGRVFGLAVSQKATTVLRDDGIPLSRNIDQWLILQERLDRQRPSSPNGERPNDQPNDQPGGPTGAAASEWALRPTDIVMVDEASMVATTDLEAIRARVDAAGARLVLTGDPRQLGPVEAGGAMDLLDGHAETYTLTEVRRFTNEWERAASLALREGDPAALDEYDRHARLVGVATVEEATSEAARRAVADRVDGRSVVVVTASNAQAAAVANKVRDQLIDLGVVSADGGVLLGRDGNTASTGDVIACRRNDYTLGVTNRVQYTVLAQPGHTLDDGTTVPDGALLVEPVPVEGRPAGGPVLLPAEYVAADTQLSYASTVHASQGITVDHAYNLTGGGSRLDAAGQYVAQTRGRDLNVAIVALGKTADHSAPGPRTPGGGQLRAEDTATAASPRDVLAASLAEATADQHSRLHQPGAGVAATVAAERDQAHSTSMATLTGRIETITRAAVTERLQAHLDDATYAGILDETIRARLGADQASEHLARLLRVVEQDGRDPRDVLNHALTHGKSLLDARSPAQVLAHRITRGQPDDALFDTAPAAGTEIPAGINRDAAEQLARLHAEAAARTAHLGRQTAGQAPDWAVLALGPVPAAEDVDDRADWERRAGLVAAHRETVGETHPTRALDRMPGLVATERRPGYAAAWHALGRPDRDLDEAAMSDGRLRIRVQAWEREQAWQPPFVDNQLRQVETELQEARQAAALNNARADQSEASGDLDQAAALRAEAEQLRATVEVQTQVAEVLTQQSRVYLQWAAATVMTRAHAERARAEAERRGLDLDTRAADTTTAADYLADHSDDAHRADADDIAAEDTWRPITEVDIHDPVTDADREWNTATADEHDPSATEQDPSSTLTSTNTDTADPVEQDASDHASSTEPPAATAEQEQRDTEREQYNAEQEQDHGEQEASTPERMAVLDEQDVDQSERDLSPAELPASIREQDDLDPASTSAEQDTAGTEPVVSDVELLASDAAAPVVEDLDDSADDHASTPVAEPDIPTIDGAEQPAAEDDVELPAAAVDETPAELPISRPAWEIELMAASTSFALSVMADRANQERAYEQAHQDDLAIESAEAGRRRREMADLDATITASTTTHAATDDEGAGWDD